MCTGDNPLAKARELSPRTSSKPCITIIYHSLDGIPKMTRRESMLKI